MKPHVKIYMQHFGYDTSSFIPCEWCGAKAVDIHHIKARGMGAAKPKNNIQNLMALCRTCHHTMGDKTQFTQQLKQKHLALL